MRTGRIGYGQLPRGAIALACASLVACASAQTGKAAGTEFDGFWSVQWCDRANPQRECGRFDLVLAQDRNRICGDHFVATPGLSRIDEGGAVLGTTDGRKATLVIESGRNGARYEATVELVRAKLRWELLDVVEQGINNEPAIIPVGQTLTRKREAWKQERWRALKAACTRPADPPNPSR